MSDDITLEDKPTIEKKKRSVTRDATRARIIELAHKQVPMSDIARATGVAKSTVKDIIDKFKPLFKNLDRVDDFRSIKSELLAAGQLAALESAMSGTKLKKAGFLSTLQGFDILNKAERLELGKSTDNVSHKVFGSIQIGDNNDS